MATGEVVDLVGKDVKDIKSLGIICLLNEGNNKSESLGYNIRGQTKAKWRSAFLKK